VLTAAFWNANVRDNSLELAPLFAAWTSWTPTIGQGVNTNITKTVAFGTYVRVGKLVIWHLSLTITGAGVSASPIVFSYPGDIQPRNGVTNIGSGWFFDSSTSTAYNALCMPSPAVSQRFGLQGDWSGNSDWGRIPSLAVANADEFKASGMYETA
jgi:hypothetical protein